MKSLFWMLSCCLVFSFVLAAPVRNVIETKPTLSIPARSVHTTHFLEYDPSVPLKARVRRVTLRSRRQLEFFGRWLWGHAFPVIRPPRDDVYLLRDLEDPIYITAYEPPSGSAGWMNIREDVDSPSLSRASTNPIVRDILELALDQYERRSSTFDETRR